MCEKPVEVRRKRSTEGEARPSAGERRPARPVRVLRDTEAEVETEAELATRSQSGALSSVQILPDTRLLLVEP